MQHHALVSQPVAFPCLQVRATSLQELVYKQGQAGVTKASVSITFHNNDPKNGPTGYEDKEYITVTRQVGVRHMVWGRCMMGGAPSRARWGSGGAESRARWGVGTLWVWVETSRGGVGGREGYIHAGPCEHMQSCSRIRIVLTLPPCGCHCADCHWGAEQVPHQRPRCAREVRCRVRQPAAPCLPACPALL